MKGLSTLLSVSDGGLSAEHPKRSLPFAVAPAAGDSKAFNTIRPGYLTIACWRLDDARFGFDSSFIEAEASEEFATLTALVQAHPDSPLSVFGHADLTGSDEYNKTLSGRRAESVYAVLTRSVDMWERFFRTPLGHDVWGTKHVQQMLVALGFFDGPASDTLTPVASGAVKSYQAARGLDVDGDAGRETRAILIPEYMDAICKGSDGQPFIVAREGFLGRGLDPHGKADYQGCGEFNPVIFFSKDEKAAFDKPENKAARDSANSANRRILVYLFSPRTTLSDPANFPCPRTSEGGAGCKERFWSDAKVRRTYGDERRQFEKARNTFACRFYHGLAMRSACETLRGCTRIQVQLLDPFGTPMPSQACSVQMAGAELPGTTDPGGVLSAVVPDADLSVSLPDGRSGVLHVTGAVYALARPPGDPEASSDDVASLGTRATDEEDPWVTIRRHLDELHAAYVETSPAETDGVPPGGTPV